MLNTAKLEEAVDYKHAVDLCAIMGATVYFIRDTVCVKRTINGEEIKMWGSTLPIATQKMADYINSL